VQVWQLSSHSPRQAPQEKPALGKAVDSAYPHACAQPFLQLQHSAKPTPCAARPPAWGLPAIDTLWPINLVLACQECGRFQSDKFSPDWGWTRLENTSLPSSSRIGLILIFNALYCTHPQLSVSLRQRAWRKIFGLMLARSPHRNL
jgi:hypothetical protein